MSKIALSGNPSGTGTFTIASPNSNTDRTLTLPDASGTVATTADIPAATPAGSVIYFAANTAPTGYLKANGANVSRTTYAALFAAIGTTFGSGDGSTTFGLPDLRGEFLRGWDDGRGVDSGRVFGSAQLDQMQRITGSMTRSDDWGILSGSPASSTTPSGMITFSNTNGRQPASGQSGNAPRTIDFDSGNSPNARVSSTTSGETRARNVALLACIKF